MGKGSVRRPATAPRGGPEGRPSWAARVRAWSRWDEEEAEPPPGRPWPPWVCWLVSGVLLFHITATLACELAGQTDVSVLETDVGLRFWWYVVLIGQEYTHAYFAPDPENATPVVTARVEFADGRPDREVRIPDRSTRPRIRYVRQIALAWHLTHEWSAPDPIRRSYWARSYAKHLCRAHPGCAGQAVRALAPVAATGVGRRRGRAGRAAGPRRRGDVQRLVPDRRVLVRRPLSAAGATLGATGRFLARFAIGLVAYVVDAARTAAAGWHRFFFTPADPTPLGLTRIAVGLLLSWSFLTIGLDLSSNLGTDGWADPQALRTFWNEWKHGRPRGRSGCSSPTASFPRPGPSGCSCWRSSRWGCGVG